MPSKYRVREGKKGDFKIESAEVEEGKDRRFAARAIVYAVVLLVLGAGAYGAVTGSEPAWVDGLLDFMNPFLGAILGYYFGSRKS